MLSLQEQLLFQSVFASHRLRPLAPGALRGEAAQTMYCGVWNLRFAQVPHTTIHQASAAGESK